MAQWVKNLNAFTYCVKYMYYTKIKVNNRGKEKESNCSGLSHWRGAGAISGPVHWVKVSGITVPVAQGTTDGWIHLPAKENQRAVGANIKKKKKKKKKRLKLSVKEKEMI